MTPRDIRVNVSITLSNCTLSPEQLYQLLQAVERGAVGAAENRHAGSIDVDADAECDCGAILEEDDENGTARCQEGCE